MVALDPTNLRRWYDQGLEDLRYKYDCQPGDLVVDVGAYEGEWSTRMIREHKVRAVAIEPTDAIDRWNEGAVIKKAAWICDGVVEMSRDKFASSIYGDNLKFTNCIDLAEFLKQAGPVKVLKINIEGSEYAVLKHLINQAALGEVENIQVQFHTIKDEIYQTWYAHIAQDLSETHFLTWRYDFVWENWKRK